MNCEQVKPQFADYLVRNLNEEANTEVQRHLAACDSCRNELQILESTWTRLGALPEQQPSPTMRARFYAALEAYQDELQSPRAATKRRVTLADWLEGWWPKRPAVQLATALLLFVVGLGMGRWLPPRDRGTGEMAHLRDEAERHAPAGSVVAIAAAVGQRTAEGRQLELPDCAAGRSGCNGAA